ncbi:hypothetical protein LTR84_011180 [Exophiala bonariae]|uniref:Transcription factor domain-containing protein n=1 Tax=Exophiala bonariae TaxID=1690606 RepID=A0AAV9NM84_9EURO|nr:hypothetical protein LTR84_011180 [Exophiala bonariae]
MLLRRTQIEISCEISQINSPTPSYESLAVSTPDDVGSLPVVDVNEIDQGGRLEVDRAISMFPDLTASEFRLLDTMLDRQIDVDKYLLGPSFREQHRQTFIDHIKIGMPLVKDAFIACATLLVGKDDSQLVSCRGIGFRRAAAAVASLRELELYNSQDASLVLIFGMAMVTFALHHSGGEASLCRRVLGLVKPLHDNDLSLIPKLGTDGVSFLICLLGTEITICLLQCQVPSIRLREHDFEHSVDRFIGVSASILTHMYDICALSQMMHGSQYRRGNLLVDEGISNSLTKMEDKIEQWQPSVPKDFLQGHFTTTEVVIMLTQAKVLRLANLLVVHRLRYAFSTYMARAKVLSRGILDELNLVLYLTGKSMPFVDLAFFIACLEIITPEERASALERSRQIVDFSERTHDEIESWLISFWTTVDIESHPPIYWDDIGQIIAKGVI